MGKTTLLRKLDADLYTVGLFDFAEYKDTQGPDSSHEEYTLWHARKSLEIDRVSQCSSSSSSYMLIYRFEQGFIDRSPYSNHLYGLVYKLLDNDMVKPDDYDDLLRDIPTPQELSKVVVIFLPSTRNSYEHIVANMKRRANGIDRLDAAYVEAQTNVFGDYARVNNLPVVLIDFDLPYECYIKQYNNIYRLLCGLIR